MESFNTNLFETLQKCRAELNETNSSNDKKEIISKYPELIEIFNYTLDPFKRYFITTETLDKHLNLISDTHITSDCSFYKVLDKLRTRQVSGYDAFAMVNFFISCNIEHEELIRLILDKDLKCGVGASLLNKVFPKTVPVFDVALAKPFEDKMLTKTGKNEWHWDDWIVERKLDGIRCVCMIDNESNAKFFSRTGKEFHTLGRIAEEIKKNGIKDMVLDGEICIVDEKGDEDFTAIAKEYNKKNHTILKPKYIVFDQLTHDEFKSGTSEVFYDQRLSRVFVTLQEPNIIGNAEAFQTIECIEACKVINQQEFEELKEMACKSGWEGLILRKDVPYEGKRTKNVLKVKQFHEAEYTVHDYGIGKFRVINKDTKLEEEIITMTNVLISHKGNTVSVGSGFSIDERKHYFENPQDIIGKEITVKYFEESKNQKDDSISLRFPTVKKIWKDGRNV